MCKEGNFSVGAIVACVPTLSCNLFWLCDNLSDVICFFSVAKDDIMFLTTWDIACS